jgi:hypothetical protein
VVLSAATSQPAAQVAVAAPAAYDASFQNLPTSVRAGDALAVQVGVPSGSTCDGNVAYRDGTATKLISTNESNGRCRWDIVVPTDARRGTADISVTAKKSSDQTTIQASFEVTRDVDVMNASFHDVPELAKRGETVTIRADVSDGSTCVGNVTYDDGHILSLDSQAQRKNRCIWTTTVPSDAVYGPAKVRVTETLGNTQTTIASSFTVDRQSNGSHLVIGYRDLPATVRRDDSFVVRLQVPDSATCSGSIAYYGVAPQSLDNIDEQDGECRWTGFVPADARPGTAEVQATAKSGSDQATVVASVAVDRASSSVDASFKDLPASIQRKQNLEIRVNVPDGASCDGTFNYYDTDAQALGAQSERKNRCLWEVNVPPNAPRGTATVRVLVADGPDSTTLVSNLEVLAKGEVFKADWASDLPSSVKPGKSFDIKISAPPDVTCSGKISYADGMQWTLGKTNEDKGQCQWSVTVPVSTGPGKATVEITTQGSTSNTMTGTFNVEDTSS